MKKILLSVVTVLILVSTLLSQVAINTNGTTAASSTMLDVSSTTKGIRIPRMTSNERKTIQNPDIGLLVYDTDRQTIYLFDGVEWKAMMSGSESKLPLTSRSPEGAYEFASFGESAAIYGDYAVVGAPTDSANGVYCGAVYVFGKENTTWVQLAKLTPSNGTTGDMFGTSVDIFNDIIVVGAPEKTISGISDRGRVYVFKRLGRIWSQVIGLQASNGAAGDKFGTSVCFNSPYIIVGAPFSDFNGAGDAGSVYIFGLLNNVWTQKAILHAGDYAALSEFGTSLSIYNSTLVVGAPGAKTAGQTTGGAYIFGNTDLNGYTWIQQQKLFADFGLTNTSYGQSVAVYGNKLIVGSPHLDNGLTSIGAIWRYQNNGNTWGYTGYSTIAHEYLIMGYEAVTDGSFDIYNMNGWNEFRGRVAVRTNSDTRYLYHDDPDLQRIFGYAIDMHNGQIVITSKNTSLSNRNGNVHFGRLD